MTLGYTGDVKVAGPEIKFGARHNRCPYCHEAVQPTEAKAACNGCMAWQHEGCWSETRQVCASCGQQQVAVEATEDQGATVAAPRWGERMRRRCDPAFVAAVGTWLIAGALVGAVVAAWGGQSVGVPAALGALLGALFGVFGGLWLIPAPADVLPEAGEREAH